MKQPMKLSPAGLALIRGFENFKPTAYKDIRGIWTLGFGRTAGIVEGMTCTYDEALGWLDEDTDVATHAINLHVSPQLNQNQFDALTSLVYNIGIGNFEQSTLLRELNQANYQAAADQFLVWKRAGNNRSALLPRRERERALFLAKPS